MKSAPLVYTGADVSRFANMPMMGCQTVVNPNPNIFKVGRFREHLQP
jgi:hypothetical protein